MAANPILLGEDVDNRLGLDSAEAQDGFIRSTGLAAIPSYRRSGAGPDASLAHGGEARARAPSRSATVQSSALPPVFAATPFSNLYPTDFPPLPAPPPYPACRQDLSALDCAASPPFVFDSRATFFV